MEIRNNRLHLGELSVEELVARYGTPLYVYEEVTIRRRLRELAAAIPSPHLRLFYACKANGNPALLRIAREEGAGLDAVSPGEILLGFRAGFRSEEIMFTCSNITDEEMDFAVERGILVNVDSLSALRRFGRRYRGQEVCVRLCPDVVAGFVDKVQTGHAGSKFGILTSRADRILEAAVAGDLRVAGLHSHTGSGIRDPADILESMKAVLDVAVDFPDLRFLNFGGGFKIPYTPDDRPIPLSSLGPEIAENFSRFVRGYGRELELCFEPGKWVVAEAGHVLSRVNTLKRRSGKVFVGTDLGFSQFIRPAFYGAYHEVVNGSRVEGERETVDVVGNICESCDVQATAREVTRFEEGDVLVFRNAGAYCFSMASAYNGRPLPAEVLVDGEGQPRLIRRRETFEDLTSTLVDGDHP
jgi:diaminopimelate decarboxylase